MDMMLIDAIRWYFGLGKMEARCMAEDMTPQRKNEILYAYFEHTKKAFYID